MICTCGKCGKEAEIVCLVDDIPWCEECLMKALGPSELFGEKKED